MRSPKKKIKTGSRMREGSSCIIWSVFHQPLEEVQNVDALDNEQPVIKANIIKALVGSTNMPWTQKLH